MYGIIIVWPIRSSGNSRKYVISVLLFNDFQISARLIFSTFGNQPDCFFTEFYGMINVVISTTNFHTRRRIEKHDFFESHQRRYKRRGFVNQIDFLGWKSFKQYATFSCLGVFAEEKKQLPHLGTNKGPHKTGQIYIEKYALPFDHSVTARKYSYCMDRDRLKCSSFFCHVWDGYYFRRASFSFTNCHGIYLPWCGRGFDISNVNNFSNCQNRSVNFLRFFKLVSEELWPVRLHLCQGDANKTLFFNSSVVVIHATIFM